VPLGCALPVIRVRWAVDQGDGAADGCGAARLRAGGSATSFRVPAACPAVTDAIPRRTPRRSSGHWPNTPRDLRCRPRSSAPGRRSGRSRRLHVRGAATAASSVSPGSALEANAGCPQPRIEGEAAARGRARAARRLLPTPALLPGVEAALARRAQRCPAGTCLRRFRPRAPTGWCAGRGAASANRPGDARMGARLSHGALLRLSGRP